ncbi:hypothetical protein IWZ03DRAFT_6925 [Phyllosticta citriasiana]|uniref:Uncharacterized protein n=1 Tax=Phyllosticta citriasiana TaxID=595635 RepID=A0ABR1L1T1_9PEZI
MHTHVPHTTCLPAHHHHHHLLLLLPKPSSVCVYPSPPTIPRQTRRLAPSRALRLPSAARTERSAAQRDTAWLALIGPRSLTHLTTHARRHAWPKHACMELKGWQAGPSRGSGQGCSRCCTSRGYVFFGVGEESTRSDGMERMTSKRERRLPAPNLPESTPLKDSMTLKRRSELTKDQCHVHNAGRLRIYSVFLCLAICF